MVLLNGKVNKKMILKIFIAIVILLIITALTTVVIYAVRNSKINKQLMSNVDMDNKVTTTFSNGKNIILDNKTLDMIKSEGLDLVISNSDYIAKINNEDVTKNINVDLKVKKDNSFDNAIFIETKNPILSELKVNTSSTISSVKYLSEYYNYYNGSIFINNDTLVDESGFCNVKLENGVDNYLLAEVIPNIDDISIEKLTIDKGENKDVDIGIPKEKYTLGTIFLECEDKEALEINNLDINALKVGEYKAYIKVLDKQKEISIKVIQQVEKIELNKTTLEVVIGKTSKIDATVLPQDAENKELIWKSSNEEIATVDNEGNVSGIAVGNCEITVSSKENTDIIAKVQVEVKELSLVIAPPQTDGITYINGIMLVNKTHPIPSDYAPGLIPEAYNAFLQLQQGAKDAGFDIQLLSGFRSYETQRGLYNNYVATYGQAEADTFSARPGTSEHQTGLAMDVGWIDDAYADTPSGKWLAANCYKYGFIIRYPKDKENITGYKYEPWHIRYLGVSIATDVYNSGLCLEEYLGVLD